MKEYNIHMGKFIFEKLRNNKKNIFKYLLTFLILLWIPTVIVLLLGGENNRNVYDAKESGKTVIIEKERGKELQRLDVEEFIPCAVAGQIDINSQEELIKAFTVIIRTYINKSIDGKDEISVLDLKLPYVTYEEMEDIWAENFTENYNKLLKAVDNTSMENIYYDGNLIIPYFHGISCGKTRNGDEVEAIGNLPYLKSVTSSEDMLDENYLSMKYYSNEEFANMVVAYRNTVIISTENPLEVVSIVERDTAGYVKNIQIGSTLFTGDEFMECFSLNSPNFQVEEYDGGVRIVVKGNGHGLGLSLCGAENMAKNGSSYKEIILYYYTDVEIK